jgi:tRNA-binding protein
MISYNDFDNIEMRVGKIMQVDDFPQARKPAYQLTIDFGPDIGLKRSSADYHLYERATARQTGHRRRQFPTPAHWPIPF